ncbi:major facilitator superfamily transporter [Nocardia nova SH22a]|uniref:Major facilitator superfamily transporter n=1 Tax=Nocardia nova SH22a TaxID=1415166 RepID=W5TFD7_9NOCA|nr:MFS transporter [Nocardia nova]AHH17917.1 major facilitator superfamily transporter [Nocardia nova SH22a]
MTAIRTDDSTAIDPHGTGGMFSSLTVPNYRYYFAGQVVSNTGTWMQRIAQDWLVLGLTGSSFAVGITTAMQFLPMLLFGLYGGVIADRFPKRGLLILTQAAMGVLAAILAVLTLTGSVEVWHVYLLALLLGMVTVVDNPTRQSFVPEIVGTERLRNAVSLNSANFQAARLIGPAVAGALIAAVGSGWAFVINACSFAAVIAGLLAMRTSQLRPVPRLVRRKGQLREGLRYVSGQPQLLWPIVMVGFIGTFGYNFPTVLSGFAYHVFDVDAGKYGLLNTALAAGSLAGALLASRRGRVRLQMLVATAIGFGLLEAVTAFAPDYWLFAALLTVVGLLGLTFNTSGNSMVQLATDPAMRGRVMSLYMMVFTGGTPIGGPIVGWITEQFGPRIGLFACGTVSAASAALIGAVIARSAGLSLRITGRRVSLVPRADLAPTTGTE